MSIQPLIEAIKTHKARSAWDKGVKEYALDVLDSVLHLEISKINKKELLNNAENWKHYSEGGCALAYDRDIAERLCSPSDLKRFKYGAHSPSAHESWLDVQTRALHQACNLILRKKQEVLK